MAARSPSLLPEMIRRWKLAGACQVVRRVHVDVRASVHRARLCDRDGGFMAALTPRFGFFNCQRAVLILFLILFPKDKKNWGAPILQSQVQTVTEASCWPQQHIHCAKRGPKQTPLYSLIQFPLVVELQPPPLADTTLAERLPLRVPGIHDYKAVHNRE